MAIYCTVKGYTFISGVPHFPKRNTIRLRLMCRVQINGAMFPGTCGSRTSLFKNIIGTTSLFKKQCKNGELVTIIPGVGSPI